MINKRLVVLVAVASIILLIAWNRFTRKYQQFLINRIEWPISDFLTGTAQCGFQNEDKPCNQPDSMWKRFLVRLYKDKLRSPGHFNLQTFSEDIYRLKSIHGNSYRFSIEWARVQEEFTTWNTSYYHEVCKTLRDNGIRPVITLFHFVLPMWANRNWELGLTHFITFSKKIVDEFHVYDPVWITFNEPYLYVLHSYVTASRPPFRKNVGTCLSVLKNMMADHVMIYKYIKKTCPSCLVGIAKNVMPVNANNENNPVDNILRIHFDKWFNHSFFKFAATGELNLFFLGARCYESFDVCGPVVDFFGVNHYTELCFKFQFDPNNPIGLTMRPRKLSDSTVLSTAGWFVNASSWHRTLSMITQNCKGLPILVTECGVSDLEAGFCNRSGIMQSILSTINMFPDVKGILIWTLVSNVEWESGDRVRFGVFNHERKPTEVMSPIKNFFREKTKRSTSAFTKNVSSKEKKHGI